MSRSQAIDPRLVLSAYSQFQIQLILVESLKSLLIQADELYVIFSVHCEQGGFEKGQEKFDEIIEKFPKLIEKLNCFTEELNREQTLSVDSFEVLKKSLGKINGHYQFLTAEVLVLIENLVENVKHLNTQAVAVKLQLALQALIKQYEVMSVSGCRAEAMQDNASAIQTGSANLLDVAHKLFMLMRQEDSSSLKHYVFRDAMHGGWAEQILKDDFTLCERLSAEIIALKQALQEIPENNFLSDIAAVEGCYGHDQRQLLFLTCQQVQPIYVKSALQKLLFHSWWKYTAFETHVDKVSCSLGAQQLAITRQLQIKLFYARWQGVLEYQFFAFAGLDKLSNIACILNLDQSVYSDEEIKVKIQEVTTLLVQKKQAQKVALIFFDTGLWWIACIDKGRDGADQLKKFPLDTILMFRELYENKFKGKTNVSLLPGMNAKVQNQHRSILKFNSELTRIMRTAKEIDRLMEYFQQFFKAFFEQQFEISEWLGDSKTEALTAADVYRQCFDVVVAQENLGEKFDIATLHTKVSEASESERYAANQFHQSLLTLKNPGMAVELSKLTALWHTLMAVLHKHPAFAAGRAIPTLLIKSLRMDGYLDRIGINEQWIAASGTLDGVVAFALLFYSYSESMRQHEIVSTLTKMLLMRLDFLLFFGKKRGFDEQDVQRRLEYLDVMTSVFFANLMTDFNLIPLRTLSWGMTTLSTKAIVNIAVKDSRGHAYFDWVTSFLVEAVELGLLYTLTNLPFEFNRCLILQLAAGLFSVWPEYSRQQIFNLVDYRRKNTSYLFFLQIMMFAMLLPVFVGLVELGMSYFFNGFNLLYASYQLNILPWTKESTLKETYLHLSLSMHPDKCPLAEKESCKEQFIVMKESYDYLKASTLRIALAGEGIASLQFFMQLITFCWRLGVMPWKLQETCEALQPSFIDSAVGRNQHSLFVHRGFVADCDALAESGFSPWKFTETP